VFIFLDRDLRLRSGWVIAIFALLAAVVRVMLDVLQALLGLYPREPFGLDDGHLFFSTTISLLSALTATLFVAWVFKRLPAVSRVGAGRRFAAGLGVGALACTAAIVGAALLGGPQLSFSGLSPAQLALAGAWQLLLLGPTAFGEELLVRGTPFAELQRGLNRPVAVFLTSFIFGAMHLFNPGSTLIAALNVSLVGVWFALLTLKTGSLWPAMGAHVAWNWFEGFFFGQPVSGVQPARSLFTSDASFSQSFLEGGQFGPEGSGLTALVLLTACALTRYCSKQ
jgi:uncharacterized protein